MGSCEWQHQTNFNKRLFTRFFKTFERIVAYGQLGLWPVWDGQLRVAAPNEFQPGVSPGSSKLLKTMSKKQMWLTGGWAGGL
jgi:hypothetical protein